MKNLQTQNRPRRENSTLKGRFLRNSPEGKSSRRGVNRKRTSVQIARNPSDIQIFLPSPVEALTLEAKHGWTTVDLTRLLPEFLAAHKYRESIFQNPQHLRAGTDLEVRAPA